MKDGCFVFFPEPWLLHRLLPSSHTVWSQSHGKGESTCFTRRKKNRTHCPFDHRSESWLTHNRKPCLPAEVVKGILSCLPLMMTRLLAKQFDQRCPKQFVLVGLRPYKYRRNPFVAFPKSYVGMPKLLGVAFDEAGVADEICFVCGRGNDLRSYSEEELYGFIDDSSGCIKVTIAYFESFPFPDLEHFQIQKAMWSNPRIVRAFGYICKLCASTRNFENGTFTLQMNIDFLDKCKWNMSRRSTEIST